MMHGDLDWTGFYSGTLAFSAGLVAVLGAVVGIKGRSPSKWIRFLGVLASLSELGVAAFVSLSRLAPASPLMQIVPIGSIAAAVTFAVVYLVQSMTWAGKAEITMTQGRKWDLAAVALPLTAYLLILLNALIPGPEWLIALGVLWLTVSGLFQCVRYLARPDDPEPTTVSPEAD